MQNKHSLTAEEQSKVINRLRRLEGQVRGLQKMISDDRSCQDILTLLSGVRSALDSTADIILENYLDTCRADFMSGQGSVEEIISAVKLARG